jgi:hypothetical protein
MCPVKSSQLLVKTGDADLLPTEANACLRLAYGASFSLKFGPLPLPVNFACDYAVKTGAGEFVFPLHGSLNA